MPKKAKDKEDKDKQEDQAEETKPKRVQVPSKFYRDAEGHYWEYRGEITPGRNFYTVAPDWAGNINFYLFEGPNIFIESQRKPICDVEELKRGSDPVDGGNLLLTDEAKKDLLKAEPQAEPFIRQYMNGYEFINSIPRWCLWLVDVDPSEIRKCPRVLKRIGQCREFRLKSKKEATRKKADTPTLFCERRPCEKNYLAIPQVSSGNRKYIPIGWLPSDVIAGNKMFTCDNATLYQFGVLTSSVHMAWCRVIGQHLGSSYSYANTFNYNAFPWPRLPSVPWLPEGHPHLREIGRTAQAILDARAKYPKSSLADLYDERTMPPELRKAHKENDDAVMKAYGFKRRYEYERFNEEDIVIGLMYMYKEITGCTENKKSYPNRQFWLSFNGLYEDEDGEEYENED